MNVFETICLDANDPIKREFVLSKANLDITIAKAEKEFTLESGLINLSENKLFIESGEESNEINNINTIKKENSFVKVVKSICTAIKNFIGDIISTIVNLFDGRDNITPEEYFESPTGKLRLAKDARQLERIVDDEMRKGNKFLQAIASVTGKVGITDEQVDNWIRGATEKIEKLAPVVVPAVLGFGFKRIFSSMMGKNKKAVEEAEKTSTSGDITDPKKQKLINKILGFMSKLTKDVGDVCSDWSVAMNNAKKKSKKHK